jgi:hypothetical protein
MKQKPRMKRDYPGFGIETVWPRGPYRFQRRDRSDGVWWGIAHPGLRATAVGIGFSCS